MNKVVRLEINDLLHCAFHPLCSVTRSVNVEGVNYPRKAAQQYLLKHEKKCIHNPNLHTADNLATPQKTISPTTSNLDTHQPLLYSSCVIHNNNNLPTDRSKSPLLVDCAVVCAWNNNVSAAKVEQKLRNATLLSLALSASGITVWPPQIHSTNAVHSAATTIHNTKHVVLLFQAGEFKDGQMDEQFLEELRLVKQLQKHTTVLLFDAPNLLSVISPALIGEDLMGWLQSPEVHTYVVQMKFFYVIINAIVKAID